MINNTNELNEIRSYIDIHEIVSDYVALKKSGAHYWGLCPFHHEKTPSFSINRDKNIFKCFGCGAGGDAFSFLMRVKGLSFYESLQELAKRYGVTLSQYQSEENNKKIDILKLNELAKDFFIDCLHHSSYGTKAIDYLAYRGFNEEIVKKSQLGYAPDSWDSLITHLKKNHQIQTDLLEKAGLITKRDNGDGYYDKFRNRLIIPIFDENGNTLAFGGRILIDHDHPKYLNSPETTVFHKSKVLYGLNYAKESIKSEDRVIIVEGYFDVIRAMSCGLKNVVATLGTALSTSHLKILSKYTPSKKIVLAFDRDQAGEKATERGLEVIKETFEGLNHLKLYNDAIHNKRDDKLYQISILTIPHGKDPDDFIQEHGVNKFKELLNNAVPLIEYQLSKIIENTNLNNSIEKDYCVKKISKILIDVKSATIRDDYIRYVARKTGIKNEIITYEIKQYFIEQSRDKQKINHSTKRYFTDPARISNNTYSTKIPQHIAAEKNLLGLYFLDIHTNLYISEKLQSVEFIDITHAKLKYYIEQIIKEGIGSIKEFTDNLMTRILGEEELINLASGIIFNLEEQKSLKPEHLNIWIDENIQGIEKYQEEQKVTKSECEIEEQKRLKQLIEQKRQKRLKQLIEQKRQKLIGTTKDNLE